MVLRALARLADDRRARSRANPSPLVTPVVWTSTVAPRRWKVTPSAEKSSRGSLTKTSNLAQAGGSSRRRSIFAMDSRTLRGNALAGQLAVSPPGGMEQAKSLRRVEELELIEVYPPIVGCHSSVSGASSGVSPSAPSKGCDTRLAGAASETGRHS